MNTFKLNPNTFIREYDGCVYLENQAIHTRACLTPDEWNNPDEELLQQLDSAWLIDVGEASNGRCFSYAHKAANDALSDNMPVIGHGTLPRPLLQNLQIELTDACNERCIHCYLPNSKKDRATSLKIEKVVEILQQYRQMGGLKIVLSGGEILLYRDLFEILDECRCLNLMILLQTNLLALTEATLRRIKELNVFNMQVSLYSDDPEIHDSITGRKGSFEITRHNIERLVEADVPLLISCPVMLQNFHTVHSLYAYAKALGVDIYFDYMMMAECDGSVDNLACRITADEAREMIRFHLDRTPAYIDAIKSSATLAEALGKKYGRRRNLCSILSSSLCIDSDGSVYPCPGWNGMKIGNAKSMDLADIWKGAQAWKIRVIKPQDFPKCHDCDNKNFCEMCAVYNYNENGDFQKPCPRFCEMAAMLKDCVIEKYQQIKNQRQ